MFNRSDALRLKRNNNISRMESVEVNRNLFTHSVVHFILLDF